MSSMCMYQGLGQMLTMSLAYHHKGCLETPKFAYVIYLYAPNVVGRHLEVKTHLRSYKNLGTLK